MTSTFFQRVLIIILFAGTVSALRAQEYKFEIGGMAGGAFYMGDTNKNTIFKGMNPAVGAVFRYNINFRWALSQVIPPTEQAAAAVQQEAVSIAVHQMLMQAAGVKAAEVCRDMSALSGTKLKGI